MDQSLWQTIKSFDLIHSSHMWMHTIFSCGKYSTTMQMRIVSGFWFCRRPGRFKINIRWNLMHFQESHVRANKLDVQETDFSFTQFYSWNNFSRCRFMHGWNSSSWSLGFGFRSVSFFTKPTQQHQRSSTGKPVAWYLIKQAHQNKTKVPTQHDNFDLNSVDCVPSNAKFSRFGAMLYIFEDNEAVIKMIIKGRSPTMRHVSRTHRVALDWLFDRINLDPRFKSIMSTPNTSLQTYWQKGVSHAMSGTIFFTLFNISHFSSLCCAQNVSLTSRNRRQQIVATVKADDDEPGRLCLDKFFDCEQSGLRRKARGYSKHPVEQIGQVQGNLTQEIAITTQRRVLKDGKKDAFLDVSTGKLVAIQKKTRNTWIDR